LCITGVSHNKQDQEAGIFFNTAKQTVCKLNCKYYFTI
jgi:hypothetical protein